MPSHCVVPKCSSKCGGHQFPKDSKMRRKWQLAIKRLDDKGKLWEPHHRSIVCKLHFKPEDYRPNPTILGEKKLLLPDAIPNVFPFKQQKPVNIERENQAKRRLQLNEILYTVPDIGNSEIVEAIAIDKGGMEEQHDEVKVTDTPETEEKQIQCNLLPSSKDGMFSAECFKNNPKMMHYYTGFNSYDHFLFLFHALGPATTKLQPECVILSPLNQMFLTIMKLRQAKDDIELAYMFDISVSSVSVIITKWINFMYLQLRELDIWPSRQTIQQHMPVAFKKLSPSTRVILEATEIPIQKPVNTNAQSATFSSNKNRNTLKTMIGCSPRGVITFVSDSYGGSCSDRQIIERSNLLNDNMFDQGDSIMADHGAMVQDLFASKNVKVNNPRMLKGKSELEPTQIIKDRKRASKRIHVEQIIGLSKTYKILKKELPSTKSVLGDRIMFICCMLANCRNSIVDNMA